MNEEELARQLKQFQEMARENKGIDLTALSLQALQGYKRDMLSPKEKRWAYLISLGAPPFGIIFALKFFASEKEDAQQAAYMCLALTAASILMFVVLGKLMFAGSGLTPSTLPKPQDVQQLLQ